MTNLLLKSKILTIVLVAFIQLGPSYSVFGQDLAQLGVRARANLYENWNFDSAAYYFDLVIGKKYAPAFTYSDYGWYLMLLDKHEEGMTHIRQAAEMAPADKQLAAWYAEALIWSGELPKAKQWVNKALAIDPNDGEALYVSSKISSEMENHHDALKLAEKAASKDPNWRASIPLALAKASKDQQAVVWAEKIAMDENVYDAMLLMEVYALMRNDDKALDYLQKSYELRHPYMPWLKLLPSAKHLHEDPRFKDIVQKMNLPK